VSIKVFQSARTRINKHRHIQWMYRILRPSETKCDVYFLITGQDPYASKTLYLDKLGAIKLAVYRICHITVSNKKNQVNPIGPMNMILETTPTEAPVAT